MANISGTRQTVATLAQGIAEKWKKSRIVIKSEELELITGPQGTTAQVVNSSLGFANSQTSAFIREIPIGWKSGKHKHNMEAIILIIQGTGYTEIDGVKYEWKKGDVITIPPMAVHQHFNSGKEEDARFFAVTTIPLMVNIGSLMAEQIETAARI